MQHFQKAVYSFSRNYHVTSEILCDKMLVYRSHVSGGEEKTMASENKDLQLAG